MVDLCEGGNEPADSLKAICNRDKQVVRVEGDLIKAEKLDKDHNNALSESTMRISYKICHEIAKELKTFNEGEFIKRCLIILVDELCPQQVGEVEAICLSRRTVVRRLQSVRMGYKALANNADFSVNCSGRPARRGGSDSTTLATGDREQEVSCLASANFPLSLSRSADQDNLRLIRA
ncbi:hypothetical protein ANN_15501 [Periplaneta americana]|uniref:Uncharacterized protein n=1 Tax=Periplaneta americana TaxID=6978 RepID=A0ABQ8SGM9_PERAM|nr:hypothetical protein ANN_15501 [Periplaneta americana]